VGINDIYMKILVLGADGMIGRAIFGVLMATTNWSIYGSTRSSSIISTNTTNFICGIDINDLKILESSIASVKPDVIINCIGLTKHREEGKNPSSAITINALFPHQLAELSFKYGVRLIHISTDCVFSGNKGGYIESDQPDASDIYGRSKILGEVYYPHTITLRTSTIGHENSSKYGLLEWFLHQKNHCQGFSKAIFSGLPSIIFAKAIRDYVIPKPELSGLYHVGGSPISKFDLLKLIAEEYQKPILIENNDEFVIDRSFSSNRFIVATGFYAPDWKEMVFAMRKEKY
jgi:dTDP-4-dehydrorhamnose reductase